MLIAFMLAAGPLAGLLEWLAHAKMRSRTYLTPIPRYIVGVVLAGLPWTLASVTALWEADALTIIITLAAGFWYVFGWAGAATWLAYEQDRPSATSRDVERLASYIAGEHDAERGSDPR